MTSLVLGWDVAGLVAAIGPNVTACKVGDEVYSRPDIERNGAYAEYVAVDEKYVAKNRGIYLLKRRHQSLL